MEGGEQQQQRIGAKSLMATVNFHVTGTTGVGSSTAVPVKGFKLPIDATNGVLVVFDKRFWSVRHVSFNDSEVAAAEDVFFRHGIVLPTASYAASNAAERESLMIQSGSDEVLQIKSGANSNAVCFLANAGRVVLQFRPNEARYK